MQPSRHISRRFCRPPAWRLGPGCRTTCHNIYKLLHRLPGWIEHIALLWDQYIEQISTASQEKSCFGPCPWMLHIRSIAIALHYRLESATTALPYTYTSRCSEEWEESKVCACEGLRQRQCRRQRRPCGQTGCSKTNGPPLAGCWACQYRPRQGQIMAAVRQTLCGIHIFGAIAQTPDDVCHSSRGRTYRGRHG